MPFKNNLEGFNIKGLSNITEQDDEGNSREVHVFVNSLGELIFEIDPTLDILMCE